jgi:trans-aconitate methyltransferase
MLHRRTQPWAADDYDRHFDFLADYGAEVVDLLDPQKGESVLDLGCGTGKLTHEIARRGAGPLGVDNDINMIRAARHSYPEIPFEVADAEESLGERRFHAVFSNAALHWMTRPVKVVQHVARALKPRGRFVAEMGGAGNIATIASALEAVCRERGLAQADFGKAWYFPTPDEYRAILESQGFEVCALDHFDRPTPLRGDEHALRDWAWMFVPELAGNMDEAVMDAVFQTVEERTRERLHHDGVWHADYKRLRFAAVLRPE